MTNYKEILRLHSLGINNTRIAESCGCARSTVITALQKAEAAGLTWDAVKNLSTEEVSRKLYPASSMGQQYKMPNYAWVHKEMQRRYTQSAVGRVLRTVPAEWRAAVQVHPVQQVLCGLCPQDKSHHALGS